MLEFENRPKISVFGLLMRSWVQDIQRSCSLFSYLKFLLICEFVYIFISLIKHATEFRALKSNLL